MEGNRTFQLALDQVHGFVSEGYSADVFYITGNRANLAMIYSDLVKPFKPLAWPLLVLTVFSAAASAESKPQCA